MSSDHNQSRYKTTVGVTLVNAFGNLVLAIIKITIGWIGFSQALIADGIHSLSDLVCDGLVFLSAKFASSAPDSDHPYGHKRIETLGAVIIAMMLIVVGIYIVAAPLWQLTQNTVSHPISIWVLITAIISILINEALFHFGHHFGRKINSKLLITNAWHNRSDAMVSLVVVFTSIAAYFHIAHIDLIGAIIIGVIIIYSGSKMIYECCMELIDTAVDKDTLEEIRSLILSVPNILSVHELRSRTHGGDIFLDVHVQVPPQISVSEGHQIADAVYEQLKSCNKHIADITVHIDPEDDEHEMLNHHLPSRHVIEEDIKKQCGQLDGYNDIINISLHYSRGAIIIDITFSKNISNDTLLQYETRLQQLPYCKKIKLLQQLHATKP